MEILNIEYMNVQPSFDKNETITIFFLKKLSVPLNTFVQSNVVISFGFNRGLGSFAA